MTSRPSLKQVSTTVLEQLRDAIATGRLLPPLGRAALVGLGIRHQLDLLEAVLAGHPAPTCLLLLDVVLAERERRKPPPELVWTGPERSMGAARDTAVVLRSLFEEARESVILAGYSFDHARDVLAPLHASMAAYGVDVRFFVDVPQLKHGGNAQEHLRQHLGAFFKNNWPFGPPRPRIYHDLRALLPGPPWCSLHAKCVAVDRKKAFISSANFTQRGQERNLEVGVLLEDPTFAGHLAAQWVGLIEVGLVAQFDPS
ncbi:MAG: DISARM system phospholipase D-like protein DrmC [Polyangiaceae bacterium]|jgi:hypothetical protein|nr:DISARM system phospholipase D-like protein DrmC [Polyangiaceae bacterium]